MQAQATFEPTASDPLVDFGHLPGPVEELLQRGVLAYRTSAAAADQLFRQALAVAPEVLAVYFCLYKTHTYRGDLEAALLAAEAGLAEAARQAGLPSIPERWPRPLPAISAAERFALYTLKALAFIQLKRGDRATATRHLQLLRGLDPQSRVGWSVVQELLDASR